MWEPASEQGPKAGLPWSIEHCTVAPASPGWKPKVGVASLVRPAGPESIPTCGAVVSTLQAKLAGVWSALPALSIARTSKLWAPSGREV